MPPAITASARNRSTSQPKRLLALGISQGGYWLPRALAFEHRFVAAVVDDGVWDVSRAWYASLPQPSTAMPRSGERDRFNQAMAAAPADPRPESRSTTRATLRKMPVAQGRV
ncbi:MAG: prolyl oligopeptidase family serine peptidase [Trebonia sp.]